MNAAGRKKDKCPISVNQSMREFNCRSFSFVHLQPSPSMYANSLWGRSSALLSPPIQMLSCFGNTLQTHTEILFNQLSGQPLAQSNCYIKQPSQCLKGDANHVYIKEEITFLFWSIGSIHSIFLNKHFS
jgi:hypothetical protein